MIHLRLGPIDFYFQPELMTRPQVRLHRPAPDDRSDTTTWFFAGIVAPGTGETVLGVEIILKEHER